MKKTFLKYTDCVHAGFEVRELDGGITSPVETSTAYGYLGSDTTKYPRYFNTSNQNIVAAKIAKLEGKSEAMVFGSGMAAISTGLLSVLGAGDHAIFQRDLYGGTRNAVDKLLSQIGVEVTWTEFNELTTLGSEVRPNTKLVYLETPSNPLLKIVNIQAIADFAKQHGLVSIIDNTFASPINQNPGDFGIDIVLHSATKYLGGHSDLSAGVAAFDSNHKERMWQVAINLGGSLDSQACSLLERSIKTLAVRVNQQNSNAQKIAEWLDSHPGVSHVYYPGLPNHPNHQLAAEQMRGFGGMLAFDLGNDLEACDSFVKHLKLIKPAISLGGVETIISSPLRTSHSLLSTEAREKMGITEGLLRLSVGIEDPSDLITDLEQALKEI